MELLNEYLNEKGLELIKNVVLDTDNGHPIVYLNQDAVIYDGGSYWSAPSVEVQPEAFYVMAETEEGKWQRIVIADYIKEGVEEILIRELI